MTLNKTLSILTLSLMKLRSITTLGIITLSITTPSLMTISIITPSVIILSIFTMGKMPLSISSFSTIMTLDIATVCKMPLGITLIVIMIQSITTPCVNVIKLFPSSLMMRPNKLKHLSLETLSSQVLEFEGKARANPIGAPFRCFLLLVFPAIVRPDWKVIASINTLAY